MTELNLLGAGNVLDLLQSEEGRFRSLDETGGRWEKGMVATSAALGTAAVGISASGSYLSGMFAVYPNAPLAGAGAALQAVPTLDAVTPGGALSGGKAFNNEMQRRLDEMQLELAKAVETGNWDSQSLKENLSWLEENYPIQNKFMGIYASPDFIDILKYAIENKKLTISETDWDNIIADLAMEKCFPSSTLIMISTNESKQISEVRAGDIVLAFDPVADSGRGALVPRRIVRLYRSTTSEWVKLTWLEDGETKELISTPRHHFLDAFGQFPCIEEMLNDGVATVVLASGELTEVRAERIVYSDETMNMFGRAVAHGVMAGNAALQPVELDAWETYNFEVEDLHTYVAGGVRVHNDSGLLGAIGTALFAPGVDGNGTDVDGLPDRLHHRNFFDGAFDFLANTAHAIGTMVNDILSGEAFSRGGKFAGMVDDGNSAAYLAGGLTAGMNADGQVATHYVGSGFNVQRVYSAGKFAGQQYRSVGDYNEDGHVSVEDNIEKRADWARDMANNSANNEREKKGYLEEETKARAKLSGEAGGASSKPILLDLDGNGVKITEYNNSTQFMTGKDGLQHKTSWAGAGDGVLFYDPDGRNAITEERQYVFTEWNPTAAGDLEALRSVWDTNGDGKLSAADTEFTKFKVLVTNADGSTSVQTLAQLGITEINLTANTVNIELPDGSVITGQTTFTRSNGTTGTVANTTLTADAAGYRVEESATTNFAGERVLTQTGYDADGGVAFRVVSATRTIGRSWRPRQGNAALTPGNRGIFPAKRKEREYQGVGGGDEGIRTLETL